MRIIVIGGTGHIGTYLIPRLVEDGHEVFVISRQQRSPYQTHVSWHEVNYINIDRTKAEQSGTFGKQILNLGPEVVIDLICFTQESAQHLVRFLQNNIKQFIHCGTIGVHGHSVKVPTCEVQPRHPFGDYGVKKAAIEKYLLDLARTSDFPVTILHPGHIVGPGWIPLNPAGNYNPQVFNSLLNGDEVILPNFGMETLHHVHADDVAQAFLKAVWFWKIAQGESFHITSAEALTLRGYAESLAGWFGKNANLKFVTWPEWQSLFSQEDVEQTWDHIAHSPNCSIGKAKKLLDYCPRFSSLQAIIEAITWMINNGDLKIKAN